MYATTIPAVKTSISIAGADKAGSEGEVPPKSRDGLRVLAEKARGYGVFISTAYLAGTVFSEVPEANTVIIAVERLQMPPWSDYQRCNRTTYRHFRGTREVEIDQEDRCQLFEKALLSR